MSQVHNLFKIYWLICCWFTCFVQVVNLKLFCHFYKLNQNKHNFMFKICTKNLTKVWLSWLSWRNYGSSYSFSCVVSQDLVLCESLLVNKGTLWIYKADFFFKKKILAPRWIVVLCILFTILTNIFPTSFRHRLPTTARSPILKNWLLQLYHELL